MTFGERLMNARVAMNLQRKELAEKAGIAERSIYNYELQGMHPQAQTVKRLAEVLNVTTSYLLGDDPKTANPDHEKFFEEAKKNYGYKGKREAEDVLERASALFAGGDIGEDEKEILFQSLTEAFFAAKDKARKKFSGKKRASAGKTRK